jgi:hypothetical protein
LHNKPQGCGASVASAAGPFITKKNCLSKILGARKEDSPRNVLMKKTQFFLDMTPCRWVWFTTFRRNVASIIYKKALQSTQLFFVIKVIFVYIIATYFNRKGTSSGEKYKNI